jgi:TPR repeat protein
MRVLAFVYTTKRKTKDRIHTAASLLRQAAKAGDCAAHHELGLVYQNGLGTVSAKPERAFTLFRRSAVTGYRPAQLASAIAYGRGMGTLPSGDAARYWAKRYFASQLQR